jgi:hypothetical protein
MSFEAMTWAVKQTTANAGQKLVLLLLANHANGHTGQCNPSQGLLATECCMGLSTLRRHLIDLEHDGHITVVHKFAENMKRPSQYYLNIGSQNRAIDHPNWMDPPSKSDVPLPPNRMIEPRIKTSNRTNTVVVQKNNYFDEFWKAYPRKTNKGFARKVFDKLKVDDAMLTKMIQAIYAQNKTVWKDKDQQYIPHPSTWLNGERWDDEIVAKPMSASDREKARIFG